VGAGGRRRRRAAHASFSQTQDQLRDVFASAGIADRLVVLHPGESADVEL
jgi:hypothetical protein